MRRSDTCSACAGKDEKCQTVQCSLALFLCLEDAFIVFGDSVQTDNKSDDDARKGDDLAKLRPKRNLRVFGNNGQHGKGNDGSADDDGTQTDLFAEGNAVLSADALSVIPVNGVDISLHIVCAKDDAEYAQQQRKNE